MSPHSGASRKNWKDFLLRLLVAVASAASDNVVTKRTFGFILPFFPLSSSSFLRIPPAPPAAVRSRSWTILPSPRWRPGQRAAVTPSVSVPARNHMHGATTRSSNDSIQVGTCTIAGTDSDRPQKVNQDAFFSTSFVINTTSASHQKDYYVCAGVMDGHGLKGHVVTDFLAKQLPLCIQKQLHQPQRLLEWEEKVADLGNYYCQLQQQQQQQQQEENHDDVQHHHQILINAFHQAHVQAMENPEVPAGRSGATCIACLVDKDDIHVASVGDSRAIRIFLTGPLSRPETTIAASPMVQVLAAETTVQKMPTERARIEACIQKQQQQEQGGGGGIRIDANGNIWYGPVAIAMTRALGDAVMLRAGVIPTPIVETFSRRSSSSDVSTTLRSADPSSLIIMATDGIWDVLNNDQVAEIAQSTFALTNSVDEVASILSQTARQRWKGDIGMPLMDEKSDDISCVCIHC